MLNERWTCGIKIWIYAKRSNKSWKYRKTYMQKKLKTWNKYTEWKLNMWNKNLNMWARGEYFCSMWPPGGTALSGWGKDWTWIINIFSYGFMWWLLGGGGLGILHKPDPSVVTSGLRFTVSRLKEHPVSWINSAELERNLPGPPAALRNSHDAKLSPGPV